MLRTTFRVINGSAVQHISPAQDLKLLTLDLSTLAEAERERRFQKLASEEARQPFDLERGPLLRFKILKLEEAEHVLLLSMHHIISDGWSLMVFTREVAALYEAFCAGRPSPLPLLPVQYADFAVWQRQWLQGEVLEHQRRFWKKQLGGDLPVIDLPSDYPRPPVQTFRGAYMARTFPASLTAALRDLCRREGVTMSMLLLAAFNVLLYRYTGQEDLLVGTTTANRNRAEIEGLIGFFVNTLVMRTDLSASTHFLKLLRQVRETALEAHAHQDMPFERLLDELQPKRDISRPPLFQIMFDWQPADGEVLKFPGLTLSVETTENWTAKFDLTLNLREREDEIEASFEYNTDLFKQATIERLPDHFHVLLKGIVVNPARNVSSLPLLTTAEQR